MNYYSHIIRHPGIALATALIASLSFAGQAQAKFEGPGTYVIEVERTPQVLDVKWNLSNPGQPLIRWLPNNGANQQFNVLRSPRGGYIIKPVHSGLCLDLPLGETKIGTEIIQFLCGDQASQRFYIKKIGAGLHRIRSAANKRRIFNAPAAAGPVRLGAESANPPVGMRFRFRRV